MATATASTPRTLSPVSSPRHPLGTKAKVLLTSVFGPYAQDDEYGSRVMNPMELYHNQVTRVQGPFSLRMFHRSWGLMIIQANISAPCLLLDFPVLDRFVEELKTQQYDIIGITSIVSNLQKVRAMCKLIRQYQPQAKIVIGGHLANTPDLESRLDADFIVRGDGVQWFRQYLGEPTDVPLKHPLITSGIGARCAGITVKEHKEDIAATVIPSVGCPMGCNFCSTSHMFGGKGKFVTFYETGDELYDIMNQMATQMGVQSFFIMDENFLLYRKRAMRLLELMEQNGKPWSIFVFSSANALRQYTYDELVRLGVSWVWMGLEGESSQYHKLKGTDTFQLIRDLQSHGIRVLGSSIIGLETHGPDNINDVIEYAAGHGTDFHQFMLYTPLPGTLLHAELKEKGMLKEDDEYDAADIHGQLIFRHRHPRIPPGEEGNMIRKAFERDFEVNGPSVLRIVRSTLAGWLRYKNHPDPRVRARYRWEARGLAIEYTALVAASLKYYKNDPVQRPKIAELLATLKAEFGWKAKLAATFGGPYVLWKMRAEEKRLAAGWTYEPPTFYEGNAPAMRTFATAAQATRTKAVEYQRCAAAAVS